MKTVGSFMNSDTSPKVHHVEVTLKVTEPPHRGIEHASDLTIEALQLRFLDPYRRGEPIVIRGRTIRMNDLHRIRVYKSHQRIGQVDKLPKGTIVDVTDQFITGPPGWGLEELTGGLQDLRPSANTREVFVVHGRNSAARQALFEFLRAIDLRPLEWSEAVSATGKASPYVGEILDAAFSRAHAVVVLFTPDDEARLRDQLTGDGEPSYETSLTGQARPNVLFEAGMAFGRSEDRTVLVELGTLRPFSDVAGRHVIRLNDSTQRRQELAQRLQAAGYPVNLDGTDWQESGNFRAAIDSLEQLPSSPVTAGQQHSQILETVQLSEEAIELLVEAAKDDNGMIIRIKPFGGLSIQTNGREFVEDADARTEAKWEQVLVDLQEQGYVEDQAGDNQVFHVTHLGFEAADNLGASN